MHSRRRRRVAVLLPSSTWPSLRCAAARKTCAFVRCRSSCVPVRRAARLTCAQTNYRAYVSYRGQRGAYFFATHLDSVFVIVPRTVWSMPWHRSRVTQRAEWAPGCRTYAWDGAGECDGPRDADRKGDQDDGTSPEEAPENPAVNVARPVERLVHFPEDDPLFAVLGFEE